MIFTEHSPRELIATSCWRCHSDTAYYHLTRGVIDRRDAWRGQCNQCGQWYDIDPGGERDIEVRPALPTPAVTSADLLDQDQLAAMLGVSASTLRAMRAQPQRHRRLDGIPAPIRHIGNSPVWDRGQIEWWIGARPASAAVSLALQRAGIRGRPRRFPQLHDADWLRAAASDGRTHAQIAAKVGCTRGAVSLALQRAGITRGPRRAPQRPSSPTRKYEELLSAAYLRRRYIVEQATVTAIAHEAGCSGRAVYAALARHRIPLRGIHRGPRPDWTGTLTAELLTDMYIERMMSLEDVAAEVGCAPMTVQRALRRHGIPSRPARALDGRVYPELAAISADTDVEAAEITGASQTAASRARRKAGIPPAKGAPALRIDVDELRRMRDDGLTLDQIAARTGWHRTSIWRRTQKTAAAPADPVTGGGG